MALDRYKSEMVKLRDSRKVLERSDKELEKRVKEESDSKAFVRYLKRFCTRVSSGSDRLSYEERQQLLRLVLELITVEKDRVRVETILRPSPNVELRTLRPELVEGQFPRIRYFCATPRLSEM